MMYLMTEDTPECSAVLPLNQGYPRFGCNRSKASKWPSAERRVTNSLQSAHPPWFLWKMGVRCRNPLVRGGV